MNKCVGCGCELQDLYEDKIGFTKNINNELCERCFRIKHYSDYKLVSKDNSEYISILKNIGSKKDLVVLVVDIFNIPKKLEELKNYLNNDILLVLTKRDVLPLSVYDVNLANYFKRYKLNIVDTVIISSIKNYNFDILIDKIREYKKSKDVYVVGYTNAGKSTMINKILYNYTDIKPVITTSMLPSTTIDSINIDIDDDLTLIDTPGLLDENNMIDYVDINIMKNVIPTKEIKPITYQIKAKQSLLVNDLIRLDVEDDTSITFYISNKLEIDRKYKDTNILTNLCKHELVINDESDIVINGFGFIKFVKGCNVTLYTIEGVDVYVRPALI